MTKALTIKTSVIVEIVAIAFCVIAGAGGHGTYLPAKLLFPITMISTGLLDEITLPFIVIALTQFPLYRLIYLLGTSRWGSKRTATILGIGHLSLVLLALVFSGKIFRIEKLKFANYSLQRTVAQPAAELRRWRGRSAPRHRAADIICMLSSAARRPSCRFSGQILRQASLPPDSPLVRPA